MARLLFLAALCAVIARPCPGALSDTDPRICRPLGVDRASKWLIRTAVPGRDRLTPDAARSAAQSLFESPEGRASLAAALAAGDYRLHRTLTAVLGLLGLPGDRVADMLAQAPQAPESLKDACRAAAAQAGCLDALLSYLLDTPEAYPEFVAGLNTMWPGRGAFGSLLQDRAAPRVRDASLWKDAASGRADARRQIVEALEVWLDADGAFVRQIRQAGAAGAAGVPYRRFWRAWTETGGSDPLLLREAISRIGDANLVYSGLQSTLADGIPAAWPLFDACLAAARPNTRYEWIARGVLGQMFRPGMIVPDGYRSTAMATWAEKIRTNQEWCDYLLWHLTRPGSVCGERTIESVGAAISTRPELAELIYRQIDRLGPEQRAALDAAGADSAALRRLVQNGTVRGPDWTGFGGRLAPLLTADWRLAQEVLFPSGFNPADAGRTREILAAAVPASAVAADVWIQTLRKSDPVARRAWIGWMVAKGLARDEAAASAWLDQTAAGAAGIGQFNPALGQWKRYWTEWLATKEGFDAVRARLGLDLWAVSGRVRGILVDRWSSQPEAYYRWRASACGLPPSAAGVIAKSGEVLSEDEEFARAYLDGCIAGDLEMLDLVEPVWRSLFQAVALVSAFEGELRSGPILGEPYAAASLAMLNAIGKHPRETAAVLARLNIPWNNEELARRLRADGESLRKGVFDALLAEKTIWQAWRDGLYSAVLFAGKARAAAALVARDGTLARSWRSGLNQLMAGRPDALAIAIRGLARQRAGDVGYALQVRAWEKRLMSLDASNQLFFEQMVKDPSGGLKALVSIP